MSLQWSEDGLGGRNVTAPLKFKISVAQLHSKPEDFKHVALQCQISVHLCFPNHIAAKAVGMCVFQGLQGYVTSEQPPIMDDPDAFLIRSVCSTAHSSGNSCGINWVLLHKPATVKLIPTHPRNEALWTGSEMKTLDPLFDPKVVFGFTQ